MNRGEKHHRTRLTAWDVTIIRRLYHAGMSLSRLAREYGYTPSGIYDIVNELTWKHVHNNNKHSHVELARINATVKG